RGSRPTSGTRARRPPRGACSSAARSRGATLCSICDLLAGPAASCPDDRRDLVSSTENIAYDVFVNDPPPQDNGLLPNGEPKQFSPMASTLILGSRDAVLTDPGLTTDQARVLGDWVAAAGRTVTASFVTHGHGDHWFAAGLLAERFGARVVATAGTIEQMHANVAARPFVWDKVFPGIPPSAVTAVTVPGNRFALEGHDLVIVEVGHTDTSDTSVLHVPDLDLVVAGDV